MNRILWASFRVNLDDGEYQDFVRLAGELNIRIGAVEEHPPLSAARLQELVAESDGLFITFHDLTCTGPHREVIVTAIRNGKRAIIEASSQDLNLLLLEFDLAVTEDRILIPDPPIGHPRSVPIRRSDQRNAASLALFDKTDLILIESPSSVWCGSQARPILFAPADARLLTSEDYLRPFDRSVFCCGGYYTGAEAGTGGLLVIAGSAFCNPCQGLGGEMFSGIRSNRGFAERVLGWCVRRSSLDPSKATTLELVHSIEICLHEIVKSVLKRQYNTAPDAWLLEGFPSSVLDKLKEQSSKNGTELEDGIYLIAYKNVISHRWNLFEPYFGRSGSGKARSLDWFQQVNDIRNRLSHPRRLVDQPISISENELVVERQRFVQEVYKTVSSARSIHREA